MAELIFHVSALTEQGTYEFDVPTNNADFAEAITDALAAGLAVFKTTGGETVALNGSRLLGVIIAQTDTKQNSKSTE